MSLLKRRVLALDFITTLDCTPTDSRQIRLLRRSLTGTQAPADLTRELLQSAKRDARHSAGQATDSVSRSRDEITVETPSPRMLTPYKASAISIVRFW